MKIKSIKKTLGEKLIGGSLPDIDSDFESTGRGEIKQYMEDRFGANQVSSVGTFTTLKIKSAIKDLDRQFDNNVFVANTVTSILDDKDTKLIDIYKRAVKEPKLKEYIQRNSDIFHMMPSILNQPKALSIHPCAIIISPSIMTSQEWFPVRKQNGLIVAEWSGGDMDDAGFLKQDILGIKQLDKFASCLKLIEDNGKQVPDIYNLSEDNEVYRYFSNGWNGDVFQMGTEPLSAYTKYLKPDNIEDLIATVSLYRPGPMENNYHNIYAKCKNEGRSPKYLWGTEDITRNTHGILCYQEQIMENCMANGNLTMLQADDVRRAMGKKDVKYLDSYKDVVKNGYLQNGASEKDFLEAWTAMLEFAKYSFNRSHAAAYAKTGYISQYLKVKFPLEYWTTSLTYADDKKVLRFLSEIFETKGIKVSPPDINKSDVNMTSDNDTNTIYWGIESIKGIGETTAEQIVKLRPIGGYKSFADFYFKNTFTGSKVKKTSIENLITSGAFDKLYNFENNEFKRNYLINRYRKFKKVKITNPTRDLFLNGSVKNSWWWLLQQKKYTGIAFIDFNKICNSTEIPTQIISKQELSKKQDRGIFRAFGGYVVDIRVLRSARGQFAFLTVENNYSLYKLILWSDEYSNFKKELDSCVDNFVVFDAEYKWHENKYEKRNVFTLKENSRFFVLK